MTNFAKRLPSKSNAAESEYTGEFSRSLYMTNQIALNLEHKPSTD